MGLKELFEEDEDRLFEEYISIPTISHALDRRRFLKYAIVSNNNRTGFNNDRICALRRKGVSEREINEMTRVYEWMEDLLEVLK